MLLGLDRCVAFRHQDIMSLLNSDSIDDPPSPIGYPTSIPEGVLRDRIWVCSFFCIIEENEHRTVNIELRTSNRRAVAFEQQFLPLRSKFDVECSMFVSKDAIE